MNALLYTRHEAAALLKISIAHLDNETRKGKIARVKLGDAGRARVMYRPVDLQAYIDAHLECVDSE